MALGGGQHLRRRPKPFTMIVLLLLLLVRISSSPIPCKSLPGDSGTNTRARLATPVTTFSTAMTHGQSQIADASGRYIPSNLLIYSKCISHEGLKLSFGSNGRGPAPVPSLPHSPGVWYRRMLPSLTRHLYRLDAAIFTGGWDPLHHTGLFYPSSQHLRAVDYLLFKDAHPDWYLPSTAEELLLILSYPNLRSKLQYLWGVLICSSRVFGRGMVSVGLYDRVPGALRWLFYPIPEWIRNCQETKAAVRTTQVEEAQLHSVTLIEGLGLWAKSIFHQGPLGIYTGFSIGFKFRVFIYPLSAVFHIILYVFGICLSFIVLSRFKHLVSSVRLEDSIKRKFYVVIA